MARIGAGGDPLRRPGDASHCRQDPDLIAGPHASVRAPVAKEAGTDGRGKRLRGRGVLTAIAFDPAQQGLRIMRVDMFAGANRRGSSADRAAELPDRFTSSEVPERKLVSDLDRIPNRQFDSGNLD